MENRKTGLALSFTADHSGLVFARQQSLRTRDLEWEGREKPLHPLWKDIAAGVGTFILFGIVIFWSCLL